jgi:hypothetical protein
MNKFVWRTNFASPAADSTVVASVETFLETFWGDLAAYVYSGCTLLDSQVSRISFSSGEGKWVVDKVLGNASPSYSFTNSDDPMPNVVAASIVGRTSRPQSPGRKQVGGLVETAALDNNLISAALTDLADAAATWLSDWVVSGAGELNPGVVRVGIDAFLLLTEVVANSILGTMRTRKPGVGT